MTIPFSSRWREPPADGGIIDGVGKIGADEISPSTSFSDCGRLGRGIADDMAELVDAEIKSSGFVGEVSRDV